LILLDGNAVDMASIIGGILALFVRPFRRSLLKITPRFSKEEAIIDLLNGVTIVPFLLMIGSVFSSELTKELIASAKVTLGIAGGVGLIFVLGELFKDN